MAESLPWSRRTEGGREGQGLAGDASGSMKKREEESFGDGGRERGCGVGWGEGIEYGRVLAGREMKFCRLLK